MTQREIPQKKIRALAELEKLIKESKSIVLVSIKNLPSSQFHAIKKKLRESGELRVPKKSIALRAIESSLKSHIKQLESHIKEDIALIFSQKDAFEISAILEKNKSRARAKAGQTVNEDVSIEPGPTELVPGPIISELGALGLKFQIEDGKITIRDKKVIVKAGDAVTEQAASIMAKLDMKPVFLGLEPIAAYDSKEDKIYLNIKIDTAKTTEDMKHAAGKALAFAVKLAYVCQDTLTHILAKANSHEVALAKLIKNDQGGQ